MISIEKQASAGGKDISLYTLDNGKGLRAQIYNLGGIIRSLEVGGREVVLGRERVEDYFENDGYLGALVGRGFAVFGYGGRFTAAFLDPAYHFPERIVLILNDDEYCGDNEHRNYP